MLCVLIVEGMSVVVNVLLSLMSVMSPPPALLLVISYLVYADDTQLYVSFKCKQPLEVISKLNSCLADIRR